MSKCKNQHYVPKLLMKNFADSDWWFYVYDKSHYFYKSKYQDRCCSKFFLPTELDEQFNWIENLMGNYSIQIDNILKENKECKLNDFNIFYSFMCIQQCRGKYTKKLFSEIIDNTAKLYNLQCSKNNKDQSIINGIMDMIEGNLKAYSNYKFDILITQNKYWILSDEPVVIDADFIFMPITKSLCLFGRMDLDVNTSCHLPKSILKASDNLVDYLNSLSINNSTDIFMSYSELPNNFSNVIVPIINYDEHIENYFSDDSKLINLIGDVNKLYNSFGNEFDFIFTFKNKDNDEIVFEGSYVQAKDKGFIK